MGLEPTTTGITIETSNGFFSLRISAGEKVRLVVRLMKGWVSDDDLDAIEAIYRAATTAERQRIQAAVRPEDLSGGQRFRLRALFST